MITKMKANKSEKFSYEIIRDFCSSVGITTHLHHFPSAMYALVKEYQLGFDGSTVESAYKILKGMFEREYIVASLRNPVLNLILDSDNWNDPALIEAVNRFCFLEFTLGSLLNPICYTYVNSEETIVLNYLYNHSSEAPSSEVLELLKKAVYGNGLEDHYIDSSIFGLIPKQLRRY